MLIYRQGLDFLKDMTPLDGMRWRKIPESEAFAQKVEEMQVFQRKIQQNA